MGTSRKRDKRSEGGAGQKRGKASGGKGKGSAGGSDKGTRPFTIDGVRKSPFTTDCPATPAEYCDENYGWAWANLKNMSDWLTELELGVDECCDSKLAGSTSSPPAQTCSDWQAAWGELQAFGKRIRPRLKLVEEAFTECSGYKIEARLPTPKPGTLPEQQPRRHACHRARDYFRQVERWGNEIREAFNDHCEHSHPTHLSPPPDPPF